MLKTFWIGKLFIAATDNQNLMYLCIYVFLIQFTVEEFEICIWLDLNWGPLVSEAIAVPTEPQPLPFYEHTNGVIFIRLCSIFGFKSWWHIPAYVSEAVWPDWAIYWTFGNFLKRLATINLPISPTFLSNFCKGVKIYHF